VNGGWGDVGGWGGEGGRPAHRNGNLAAPIRVRTCGVGNWVVKVGVGWDGPGERGCAEGVGRGAHTAMATSLLRSR
jgi:hypothetical protein